MTFPHHVLIVEDDPSTQALYQFSLDQVVDLSICGSVSEAKRILAAHPISLALVDLSLGGEEDGLELIRYMKSDEHYQHIPAIAVTAHAFPHDRSNALAAGCDEFVPKPLGRQKLFGLLETHLGYKVQMT